MTQPDLFSYIPPVIYGPRDGNSFDRKRDGAALNVQAAAVYNLMADGKWRTLREISDSTGAPEASVSARLRDFRKPKFGGFKIDRKTRVGRLFEYRIGKSA